MTTATALSRNGLVFTEHGVRVTHEFLLRSLVDDLTSDLDIQARDLRVVVRTLDGGHVTKAIQDCHDLNGFRASDHDWRVPGLAHLSHVARNLARDEVVRSSVTCCRVGKDRWQSLYECGVIDSPEFPSAVEIR